MDKRIPYFKFIVSAFFLAFAGLYLLACPGPPGPVVPPVDSTSVSELAEALVSGAVNATISSGTQARLWPASKKQMTLLNEIKSDMNPVQTAWGQRIAASPCPTNQLPGGAVPPGTCILGSNTQTIPYPICNFPGQGQTVTWSGNEIFTKVSGPTALSCTSFPAFTNLDVLTRTFSTPTSRMTPNSLIVVVDTSGQLNGFGPIVAASGETISYTGATARTIVLNGVHLIASVFGYIVWNYMMTSNTINVDGTNTVTSGVVSAQDLILKRTATITLTGLTYSAGCCTPTGGTVTTAFSDGSAAENLAFTATCGAATLNGAPITLNHCF